MFLHLGNSILAMHIAEFCALAGIADTKLMGVGSLYKETLYMSSILQAVELPSHNAAQITMMWVTAIDMIKKFCSTVNKYEMVTCIQGILIIPREIHREGPRMNCCTSLLRTAHSQNQQYISSQ